MPDLSRTLIIVPVYNETEAVLLPALRDLQQTGARIIVVDDGSDEPISLAASFRDLTLLRHPVNLEQGAALQTGMEYARRRADVDFVVHFDGDGQHPIDALPALLEPLATGQADIVLGSRFLNATDCRRVPHSRRLALQGARVFNFLVTGIWMTDAHIGLRALHRRAFSCIHFRENRMAHALGVERGADLLLYTTVVFLCSALAIIYGKFRKLDEQYTVLLRELTLLREQAEHGKQDG